MVDSWERSQAAHIAALENVLDRIISDPLVVKVLLMNDPKAWGEAVELLGESDDDEPAEYTGVLLD